MTKIKTSGCSRRFIPNIGHFAQKGASNLPVVAAGSGGVKSRSVSLEVRDEEFHPVPWNPGPVEPLVSL